MKASELILSLAFMYSDLKYARKKYYAETIGLALQILCQSGILKNDEIDYILIDKEKDYKI